MTLKHIQTISTYNFEGSIDSLINYLKQLKETYKDTHKDLTISYYSYTEPGDYGPAQVQEYCLEGIPK